MSVWLIVGLAAAGLAFVAYLFMPARPMQHVGVHQSDLERYVGTLLQRGENGGIAVVERTEPAEGTEFVQLEKYVQRDGSEGLTFSFPDAPWSRNYVPALEGTLRERGVDIHIEPTGREDTRNFVEVDCGSDIDFATELVRVTLQEVLGADPSEDVTVSFRGVRATA